MKNKEYYFAVYKDCVGNKRIGQFADVIDYLNCEILAKPGVILIHMSGIQKAWQVAKLYAERHDCTHLESLCDHYKMIKI